MQVAASLDRLVVRLERIESFDKLSDAVAAVVRRLVPSGVVEDAASGVPLAHPLHPLLVPVPIGAWASAVALDAVGADPKATRTVVGIGVLGAVPAAYTGASDWLSTTGPERRIGSFHAVANSIALGLQSASWWVRRSNGSRGRGAALSIAAFATTGVAGWLGGHLAHALGVGVDTTVFQHLPDEWTDTVTTAEVGDGLVRYDVDGVPIVLFRDDGRIVALADRCTHRGGPLHEGTLDNGCVTCPWHGSVFDGDGNVRSGPATRPQPRLDVRVVDERVQVRLDSGRTLRINPVGH
jgi:nitrite reductase/ring-hydroxylating ferredoxin subunit/uncharacterized membrane protein